MKFYPENTQIPLKLCAADFLLRPLLATDVELDYEAIMSSRTMLNVWDQSDWPTADFTLAENLADLQEHENDHREGRAFTFTVMNPEETECLGCLYIYPLAGLLSSLGANEDQLADLHNYEASASFWVRQSRLVDGLENRLLLALLDWFRQDWQFSRVVFNSNSADKRQVALFMQAGLKEVYAFDVPGGDAQYLFFK